MTNPPESVIDLEDDENADLELKQFAVFNNSGKTVAFLECDSRMVDLNLPLNLNLSDLSLKLNRERDFFNSFARAIYAYEYDNGGITVHTNFQNGI